MCKLQAKLASMQIFTIGGGWIAFLNFVPCQLKDLTQVFITLPPSLTGKAVKDSHFSKI